MEQKRLNADGDERTLLQGLCEAAGRQGGTLHQYFPKGVTESVLMMDRAYRDYIRCGITFPSPAAFDKLAALYHLTIRWT
jgi:hypothetical protein